METEGVELVFNADQTDVFFEYLPWWTVNESGATTIWVKRGKSRRSNSQ